MGSVGFVTSVGLARMNVLTGKNQLDELVVYKRVIAAYLRASVGF